MRRSARIFGLALPLVAAQATLVLAADGTVGSAAGDVVEASPAPESYGITSSAVHTVGIEAFLPPSDTVTYALVNGRYLHRTGGPTGDWWARFNLPSGALVLWIELQACDTTASGQILFGMARLDAAGDSGVNVTAVGTTGLAGTPGCELFQLAPNSTLQIDNRNFSYSLFVNFSGDTTAANEVAAVRIFYVLQVSPAPATATFPNDVPTTHPFFRFVEALAASRITGGCGTDSYCPDQPVTRGQMAVFLAAALGLHFPF